MFADILICMKRLSKSVIFGAFIAMSLPVSAQEKKGLSLADFTSEKGTAPSELWKTQEDGSIHKVGKAGNLISKEEYSDFTFEWEWKVKKAGNSGVKYWVNLFPKNQWLGIEYQMIDDQRNSDAKTVDSHTVGAIYDIKAPMYPKVVKAPGEWNHSKVEAKDGKLKHFLNGSLVVEVDSKSEEWKERIAKSKFKEVEGFAPGKGKLMLQDHNDEVFFRNLQLTISE